MKVEERDNKDIESKGKEREKETEGRERQREVEEI